MRRFALARIRFYLTPQVAWSLFVCQKSLDICWKRPFTSDLTQRQEAVQLLTGRDLRRFPKNPPMPPKCSPFSRAHSDYLQRQKGFSPIMYLLSVCSPCPGSLGCPAIAAQATPPSTWPPSQRAPPPTQLLHRSPSRSLSAPLLRSVSSSPTGTQQQAAAAAAMLLDGARRAAPGALRPPPLRIWGAWASIQVQAPKF